jgi:hypothetical protein
MAGLGIGGQGDRNGHSKGNLFKRSLESIVKVNRLSHQQDKGGFGIM